MFLIVALPQKLVLAPGATIRGNTVPENLLKILEKSWNFVIAEKWEPCVC